MSDDFKERPEPEGGYRGVRPLSRKGTRRLLLAVLFLAIAVIALTIVTTIRTAQDPGVQQGIEDFRRDTGQLPAERDTIPAPGP